MPDSVLASFTDLSPAEDDFLGDVVSGLSSSPKTLPCKYFYNKRGSKLFDQICELPEYYPTRTETSLMRAKAPEMASAIGEEVLILEYGCGSIEKVRVLLDALDRPASYVAVDISREHLLAAAKTLAVDYPKIQVHAICADFTQSFEVPFGLPGKRNVGFFPGSTIGNFELAEARSFLGRAARHVGPGGGLLIGTDRKKDKTVLHNAYNDSAGVTAQFNLNLLSRIEAELDADIDIQGFEHDAIYNAADGRIEMYLVSLRNQEIMIDGQSFLFNAGERIHTENSHKYDIEEFQALGRAAGFEARAVWSDPDELFSVHYFETATD